MGGWVDESPEGEGGVADYDGAEFGVGVEGGVEEFCGGEGGDGVCVTCL